MRLEEGIPKYNLTFLSREDLESMLRERGMDAVDVNKVLDAYDMAESVHEFQKRLDGTPYFWHPSRVAKIFIEELNHFDPPLICAALLHDALEDSNVLTPEIIELNFGSYTSYLVQKLTKDIKATGPMKDWVEREYVERLMQSSEDARMLKLADRLDTYRCLEFNVKKNPIKYIMETTEHYFPLAHGSQNPRLRYLIKELQKEQNKFLG
ncbi:MAG: HD domain-containing protein [Bacteroidota bacterium]|nr:HD domain-containing protein [Bacteroidota bacterium]MDP4234212.1 HD domain-containing protein [Bacteroidota bacterium]MDP4244128.1 HD domain-containing protein [Bacteroidota bacterium]MDP4288101.1 HD domain-containing protein [Bacteroidota bacterium]